MDAATCDRCGGDLLAASVRYVARIELFAAYDVMEITKADLEKDGEEELREIIRDLERDPRSAEEMEKDVYEELRFDLCAKCRKEFAAEPFPPRRHGDAENDESNRG